MDRVTLNDVALRARVSLATVSRALNQPALVRDSTVRRVREAAADLNFRPNLVGRNLRARTTRTLGVVLPTLANTVFADCFQGIERATRLQHYSVMLTTTEYRVEDELAVTEELLRHRVDGLILTVANAAREPGPGHARPRERAVCAGVQPVPASAATDGVGRQPHRPRGTRSGISISIGHRSIRMVTGDFRESDRAQLRYEGYRDAMRAAGLVPQPPVEVPLHTAVASEALARVPARSRPRCPHCSARTTCWRSASSAACSASACSVPGDMSVVGFDGVGSRDAALPGARHGRAAEPGHRRIGRRHAARAPARRCPRPAASFSITRCASVKPRCASPPPHVARHSKTQQEELMRTRKLARLAAMLFFAATSLSITAHAQTVICYNCPPEWADWGTELKAIKEKTRHHRPAGQQELRPDARPARRREGEPGRRRHLSRRHLRHPGEGGRRRRAVQAGALERHPGRSQGSRTATGSRSTPARSASWSTSTRCAASRSRSRGRTC